MALTASFSGNASLCVAGVVETRANGDIAPVSLRTAGQGPQSGAGKLRLGGSGATVRGRNVTRHVAMQDSVSEETGDIGLLPKSEYPPGVVRYESMVVLRPDVTDEERLAFTQRYEEFLVAGGAMFVEMFNRGMQPLAFGIKTKNMGGVLSRYLDGIYLLFIYVTKPESQTSLQAKLNKDDDVIRSTTFKLKL